MPLFIKKISLFLIVFMIITVVPGYLLDPYNVFHWDCAVSNGVEPNKNYIKTTFLLNNPEKYNAIVFGSSRVGSLHVDKIKDYKTYNMTYSAGLPQEHLNSLRALINGGVKLKKIYMGVDGFLLNDSGKGHYTQHLRCPYNYLKENPDMFIKLYCNPAMFFKYLRMKKNILNDSTIAQMYDNGWDADYDYVSKYDWTREQDVEVRPYKEMSSEVKHNMNDALTAIKGIVDLCNENDIELVVFTNPMYKTTHIRAINDGYLEFLVKLSEITPFYNFSGLNDITLDNKNYRDNSHYDANVGDLIINVIEYKEKYQGLNDQGFGWYVDKSNVSSLIDKLNLE